VWHYLFIFLIVFLVINMVVAIVVESFEENFEFRSKNPYLEDSIIKTGVIFCIVRLMPITSRLGIRQVMMLMMMLVVRDDDFNGYCDRYGDDLFRPGLHF